MFSVRHSLINIINLQLVESVDVEPKDTEDNLYLIPPVQFNLTMQLLL